MLRNITTSLLFTLATTHALSAQVAAQSEEAAEWDAARSSGQSAQVSDFIEKYPEGDFSNEARAFLIDLLWQELDGEIAAPAATDSTSEQEVVTVTFTSPLTVGAPEIIGKSIEQLIQGAPLFPPVEGLPESYWKEQTCSNCHEWERANLCDQANTYLTDAGGENLSKQHPYGGGLKLNLRYWAQGGCQ